MRHLFKVATENAQYKWECVKQMPYAVKYQNEAGILRSYVNNLKAENGTLKAENAILSEQYRTQADTINRLIELVEKRRKEA